MNDTVKFSTYEVLTTFEMDKRQYVPGYKLEWTCSACGEKCEEDFGKSYLSYPEVNRPYTVNLHCGGYDGCDYDEDTVQVRVSLTMEML